MKELLEYLARELVDEPDEVTVEEFEEDDGTLVLELSVGDDDYGKVIGRGAGTDARPIVRLASCTTRTQVEALRGTDLLVPRDEAPELEEDEWWPEQLEGCTVHDGEREVGVVRELRALPSCEVLHVARD